jgi:hypothetical protein
MISSPEFRRSCLAIPACSAAVTSIRAARVKKRLDANDPGAYQRLKEEAYVLGEGDPSPAVVTFTTEAATMAVNEWLAGVTGLAGEAGMLPTRMRRFHARDERRPLVESHPAARVATRQRRSVARMCIRFWTW